MKHHLFVMNFYVNMIILLVSFHSFANRIKIYSNFPKVGAGSAGPVVANRLSEDPRIKVLLLEAGGHEVYQTEIPVLAARLQLSEYDWQYKTVPQKYACQGMIENRSNWPRGKILGGCSSINYMLYVRGNTKDYDLWEKWGNYGWGWNDVFYYFIKSEDNRDPAILKNGYHG